MSQPGPTRSDIDRFITESIDTVPHLEALLLFWETKPRQWSETELAERLFVDPETARRIVRDLTVQGLVVSPDGTRRHAYNSSSPATDRLIEAVDAAYRRELVRISNLIHSKASGAVREFARAFEFGRKKEKDKE